MVKPPEDTSQLTLTEEIYKSEEGILVWMLAICPLDIINNLIADFRVFYD